MSASTDSRLDTHTGDTARLTVPVDKDIQPTAEIDLRREFECKRSFLRTYAVERGDGMRCPP